MGFPGKHQRAPPATSTDPIKDQTTSLPLDLEKSHVRGNEVESTIPPHEHHVLPDTEKKVIRKMDLRIVPLVTALYVLAFLDRSNIGKYVSSEPKFPLLGQILSLNACAASLYSQILFQKSIHRLKWAILTAKL